MPIYDAIGTTDKVEIKKLYDYNGSDKSQIGRVFDFNGTDKVLIYTAEETLANLETSGTFTPVYAVTGIPNEQHTTSSSYWNLSGYDYIRGTFTNTIEQKSWGSGGGEYSNGTKRTYLQFSDGSRLQLFTGDSKTFTESSPISLVGYTDAQKSKVYLHAMRHIDIPNATNTYTAGQGTATDCVAF